MASPSPNALTRFVEVQTHDFATALRELQAGRKRSHWMWYIFPQIAGLGHSAMAQAYAIADAREARAYLAHPLLGPRLIEVVQAACAAPGSAEVIFGDIDAMKLRSSLTLFAAVAEDPVPFQTGLDRFFDGKPDPETLRLLGHVAR
ncbi:DUF1810 domain-containing protein [Sphingomonas pseudosanguinis]|uniref:Uncharacterized protein (DUF1810 family) n=1 Tax=Sphingomonas pseudosanguinis TaxID=413712 RepID=A0A7W6AH58_9SPHN|nr:DUF1810 domain-containing protein [Sphingomonas pseudosanguinis]MBB3880496.1 uncharacterized protein (DUF1810 family) [Sphingomonas pseudosanguinis]MBN3537333.1 DUF1810 domain-containing protein [Sphingomonas pseudosanguinis]